MTAKPFGWRPEKVEPVIEAPTSWPEPEVRARMAEDHEIPKGAQSILKLALANEWEIWAGNYARGTKAVGGTQWLPGPVVDSFLLHVRKGDLQVEAYWVDGSFDNCYVASVSRREKTKVNSNELRAVLAGELT